MAVSDGTTTLSYAQFGRETEEAAGALARMGLHDGDAIIVLAENRLEHLILFIAAARLGLIFAPVHPGFQIRELSYVLNNSRARAAFVEPQLLTMINNAAAQAGRTIEHIITFGSEGDSNVITYKQFREGATRAETVDVAPNHPLLLIYTSGTTAMPKPVLRSHAAEAWSAQNYRCGWSFEAGDKVLATMPLAWAYGLCSLCQSALVAGASIRLLTRFHPVRVLEVVEREAITTFANAVSAYPLLLEVLEKQPFNVSSLRKLFGGAEPRNEAIIAKVEERFGVRLFEAYATSEFFPALVVIPNEDANAPAGTLGRPVGPDLEIRLVDENGQDVRPGEIGEAWLRGPGQMLEYYREPELTAERVTVDGWFKTGDLLRQAETGYYFFAGRRTDLIIRAGVNISPLEIEAVLIEHPAVRDVMVVGLPNTTKGEDVVAGVVLRDSNSVTADELLSFLGLQLSKYKVPQRIIFLEDIPKGMTGKRNRSALKAMLMERSSSAA